MILSAVLVSMALCKSVCVDRIAVCNEASRPKIARRCKKAVLKRCRRDGVASCTVAGDVPTGTVATTTTTLVTPTTTTTTLPPQCVAYCEEAFQECIPCMEDCRANWQRYDYESLRECATTECIFDTQAQTCGEDLSSCLTDCAIPITPFSPGPPTLKPRPRSLDISNPNVQDED